MKLVEEVIRGFSKQELREFKYLIAKNKQTTLRRDLQMIKEIRSGEFAIRKGNNAHYQTIKRLKGKLEQFALLENKRLFSDSQIQNFIGLSRYLSHKSHHSMAWTYLKKAENLARENESFELLNYIHNLQITFLTGTPYANIPNISVPKLLEERDANQKLAQIDGNANAAYALLIYEVKEKFATGLSYDIDNLVASILKHYKLTDDMDEYPGIYSRIVITLCRALRENKDYAKLAAYSLSSYQYLEQNKLLPKIAPDIRMEMIRAVYQSSIRTRDYSTSEKFQGIFKKHCELFKSQPEKFTYYDFRANVMAADIYMCTNRLKKAKDTLFELSNKYGHYKQSSIVFIFLRINLLALHFKLKEFEVCEKLYKTLLRQDEKLILREEGMGMEILLYTEIYGCLISFELNNPEEADYLLQRIKRKYAALFKKEEGKREAAFLKIFEKLLNNPSYTKEKKLSVETEKFCALKKYYPADKEYVNLNAWLISKRNRTDYYSCFLADIQP